MNEDQDNADQREPTVCRLPGTLATSQEQRTSRERHGDGELIRLDGIPHEASGCLLPNGTVTSARCLTRQAGLADDDLVWSRPVTPGEPLRRRGRLRIEPEALRFADEIGADAPRLAAGEAPPADLERDLAMSARMRALAGGERPVRASALRRAVQHGLAARGHRPALACQLARRRKRRGGTPGRWGLPGLVLRRGRGHGGRAGACRAAAPGMGSAPG